MRKFLFYIFFANFLMFNAVATNIKFDHEINTSYQCKFEKVIIKNAKYNYKVFTSEEIDSENLDNFEGTPINGERSELKLLMKTE